MKRVFNRPGTGRERHDCIRRVVIAIRAGEELRAQHADVITDESKLGLLMEMGDRRSHVAACSNPESTVLDGLNRSN